MTAFRLYTRGLVALILALAFVTGISACRKRKNANTANSNASTPASGSEEAKRNAQAFVDQAKELYKNDEDTRASHILEQAVKLDPNNAEAHLRLGMSYAALDRKPEADDEYKKAVELFKKKVQQDPKDASGYFYLGEAYNFLHRDEDAARSYREATRLNPQDEEAWYQLGMAETRLAQYSDAVNAFQKALAIDGNDYRATEALDDAKEGVQRIKEGKKHNEEMLKKQQENANANGNANSNSNRKPSVRRTP